MRVPLSWLLEYVALEPEADVAPAEVSRRLTAAGLEVETVEQVGHDVTGIVVAQVLEVEELTGFAKPIRYCRVSAGAADHQVICGAVNFSAGDQVPLALPGAVLPGGFQIGARKTYGRISEGMICSAAELGIGDDHAGILVLPDDAPVGADFVEYAGLRDHVLDVNVTPDKGFALSIRGVARELAISYEAAFIDPADTALPPDVGQVSGEVYPASIDDPTACDRFVLREVRGFDGTRPFPLPLRVRLARAGMRSVSLAVDVTNYLMLELGQPLHAFDRTRLSGPIVVRRARPGERLETLDHVIRDLDPDDIMIADASGPISMAGTMGGLATEISASSTELVIEAAHFSATGTARMSRRHKLISEASARFERGVDRELPLRASAKAAAMLAWLGGATQVPGCTHASAPTQPARIEMAAGYPDRVAGMSLRARHGDPPATAGRLPADGGRGRRDAGRDPPSWRTDLTDPADLAEEVIRLEGYEKIPVRMARAVAGHGRTPRAAIAPGHRAGAGRFRLRRGHRQPVQLGRRCRPAAAAPRRPAAACDPDRQPDPGGRAVAADLPAARAAPGAGPQPRARLRRCRAVRGGPDLPGPPRCAGHRAHPAGLARPVGGGTREAAGRAADQPLHLAVWSPAAADASGWWGEGARRASRTPSRRPARSCGSAGSRSGSEPASMSRGIPAGARRSICRTAGATSGWPGTPGTASAGDPGLRGAAADLRGRARHVGDRGRGRPAAAGPGSGDLDLSAGEPGRRADRA